jgi:ligand-binding SRPBCC domain-containing protein
MWVPVPLDTVWDLYSRPLNLAQLTPQRLDARVEGPDTIFEDCTVIITSKILGVRQRWVSKIHDVAATGPARRFTDVQASGPFASWKHDHLFEAGTKDFDGKRSEKHITLTEGGTWIRDRVEYRMPMGLLGGIAHKVFARAQLAELFAFRQQKTRELLGCAF